MKWIELPCEPHHNLDWKFEVSDEKIMWHFRLGLENPFFPWEDEMRFSALALALEQFTKEIWPKYQGQLCLYRGPAVDNRMYFQMLAHKLPDEAEIFLLFDLDPQMSTAKSLKLIGQYEHFVVALRGKEIPLDGYRWDNGLVYQTVEAKTGLVFPDSTDERFETFLESEVKILFESRLREEWSGLDRLIVLAETLTPQSRRMLQGFLAAGGEVVYK